MKEHVDRISPWRITCLWSGFTWKACSSSSYCYLRHVAHSWCGAERRCSGVRGGVLGACDCMQLRTVEDVDVQVVFLWCLRNAFATHSCADCRPSPGFLWNAFSTHSGAVCRRCSAQENLELEAGTLERAQFPHFEDCVRSDVAGFDGLHQLVWAVEAGWRTVVSPQCGFFRGPVRRHRAQLGAALTI